MTGPGTASGGPTGGPGPTEDEITRRFQDAARKLAAATEARRTGEPAPPARPHPVAQPQAAPPASPPAAPPAAPPASPPAGTAPAAAPAAAPAPGRDDTRQVPASDETQRLPRLDSAGRAPEPGTGPAARPGGTEQAASRSTRPAAQQQAPSRPAATAAGSSSASTPRGPRRARLVVRRVDPWSVFKISFVYASCLLVVLVVAVATLRGVLEAMGVFDAVTSTVDEVAQTGGALDRAFSASTVLSLTAVIGAINVVIVTALATLGAVLYNLCSDLVGGIEVTLADRD